jgi:hypothetical protein
MKHHKIDENLYSYDCPGAHAMVSIQNNNLPRNACYAILERAGCLIHNEISQLPDSEKSRLAGGSVPPIFGIILCSERDISAVNWRGLRTRRDLAFPLVTPLCPARPGSACIWRFVSGWMWEVLVCSDLAAREAQERNIPYREELLRYAIHGLLHLASDPDVDTNVDTDSAKRMFRRQEALIETVIGRRPCQAGRMDND